MATAVFLNIHPLYPCPLGHSLYIIPHPTHEGLFLAAMCPFCPAIRALHLCHQTRSSQKSFSSSAVAGLLALCLIPGFRGHSLGDILLSPRCFKHFWAKILYKASKKSDNIEIFNCPKHHSSIGETIMPFTCTFSSSFNITFKPKGTWCPAVESCNHRVPWQK